MTPKNYVFLLCWILSGITFAASFQSPLSCSSQHRAFAPSLPLSSLLAVPVAATTESQDGEVLAKPSFYKTQERDPRNGRPVWRERKILSDLKAGDRLEGYLVQEHLNGTTGAKVYLECGVGRYNPHSQKWKIVHGMLRLGNLNAKASVTQKRVARLRKKTSIECFVSGIRLGNAQLEVVLKEEDVPQDIQKKVSVTSLKAGQELIGTVEKLANYGAFVEVGANKVGLLHIKKVADLYGHFINEEKGLKKAGLERGAKIKVQVLESDKRLFLDFTNDVKEEAKKDRIERQNKKEQQQRALQAKIIAVNTAAGVVGTVASVGTTVAAATSPTASGSTQVSEEDDPYAAYATEYQDTDTPSEEEEDDDDDDYDDYDEDRDIEDSLGLGTY